MIKKMSGELLKELVSYCKLYSGKEQSLEENPCNKKEDEFKWHMWKVEFVSVTDYERFKENGETAEDYMKRCIQNGIDTFHQAWTGVDMSKHYDKYFSYKRKGERI